MPVPPSTENTLASPSLSNLIAAAALALAIVSTYWHQREIRSLSADQARTEAQLARVADETKALRMSAEQSTVLTSGPHLLAKCKRESFPASDEQPLLGLELDVHNVGEGTALDVTTAVFVDQSPNAGLVSPRLMSYFADWSRESYRSLGSTCVSGFSGALNQQKYPALKAKPGDSHCGIVTFRYHDRLDRETIEFQWFQLRVDQKDGQPWVTVTTSSPRSRFW